MKFSNKVDITRLKRPARQALYMADIIFTRHEETMTLLHTFDGKHEEGSAHFKHRAFDVDLPKANRDYIFLELTHELGKQYEVINKEDHLHIEHLKDYKEI